MREEGGEEQMKRKRRAGKEEGEGERKGVRGEWKRE